MNTANNIKEKGFIINSKKISSSKAKELFKKATNLIFFSCQKNQ